MTETKRQPIAECWAVSNQAPLWIAVALYAVAQADSRGHAELRPGQLRAAVAPGAPAPRVSEAIRRAVRAGWLHEDSTSWHLVVIHHGS